MVMLRRYKNVLYSYLIKIYYFFMLYNKFKNFNTEYMIVRYCKINLLFNASCFFLKSISYLNI